MVTGGELVIAAAVIKMKYLASNILIPIFVTVVCETVKDRKKSRSDAKTTFNHLYYAVLRIMPLVVDTDELSQKMKVQKRKVVEELKDLYVEAVNLINGYPKMKRRYFSVSRRYKYEQKIIEFEKYSFRRMVDIENQLNQWRDMMEVQLNH